MKNIFVLFMLSSAAWADQANINISCDYAFMGIPTTSVAIVLYPDGSLSSSALITMQGKSHKETLVADPVAADEVAHGWISKESADNSIELIVYKDKKTEGQSKLINHHVPIGQEMWGNCSGVPAN